MNRRMLLLVPFLLASGCATVEPWQRGTLAEPRMAVDVDADETSLVSSRRRVQEEGNVPAAGGAAGTAGGGGCGCH